MCDTLVALGNATADGTVLFAKNSDRQPNEPHIIVRVPRRDHPRGAKLKCTYIEIEQVEHTHEVLLLKPSWIWGCEMGGNEYGLNIGNEAVFTREKDGEARLTGMDMVRIALERCTTCDEALETIIDLLARYGQGGNCGYEKKFFYHNSFLIADRTGAWVLETAGQDWAAEKVTGVRSISNCLTIGNRFDRCRHDLVDHAVSRGWCKGRYDFHFARCYSDPLITRFSGAAQRYDAAMRMLDRAKGRITAATMREILRHHQPGLVTPFRRHSLTSICMHAGFIFGDHTTGSYVAAIDGRLTTYWVTGSSTPCIALFKPLWLTGSDLPSEGLPFGEDQTAAAVRYWQQREELHRLILENRIAGLDRYLARRHQLETEWQQIVDALPPAGVDGNRLRSVINQTQAQEQLLLEETLSTAAADRARIKGNFYFRYYWRRQNARLRRRQKSG